MKLALLLPGFLNSPDYQDWLTFEKRLTEIGYTVERLDPCHLWETGNTANYSITNYIRQVRERVQYYKDKQPTEIVLIGHSLGGLTSIIAGEMIPEVTTIVSLCSPSSIEGLATKWEGKPLKTSIRDYPNDKSRMREFLIPFSFVEDARKYSPVETVHKIQKPLMLLIGMADTSVVPEETEKIVAQALHPHVVRLPGIGHEYRQSQEETDVVWNEIEKFLIAAH